jgi:hypothetical protein
MSNTINSSISSGLSSKIYWSGATGNDTYLASIGHCPRAIMFTGAGDLVLALKDGSTLTLPESFASMWLPLGDIVQLVASGSTAHTVLVAW